MKIAIVGKGGSGKSSVSWLLVNALAESGVSTLAIDADHNMDLTSNLGVDPEKTPLMHKTDKEFMEVVGLSPESSLSLIVKDKSKQLPTFTVNPPDAYTLSISTKLSDSISLINLGLGSPDVIFAGKCAHGLSGPLKYYLGLLNEGESTVVIDSVAGTDMLNFGLYAGIDAVIGVVEPHRNSVKVYEQIADICRKSMIPCFLIINRPAQNEFMDIVLSKWGDRILGSIPLDTGILSYEFNSVSSETKKAVSDIISKISQIKKRSGIASMIEFMNFKQSAN